MAKRIQPQIPLGMVLIRVVTGLIMLSYGWDWLQSGTFDGRMVLNTVNSATAGNTGFSSWWAEHVVLKNPDASAFLWRWGAFLAGLSFLLGALTRLGGLVALGLIWHAFAYGPADPGHTLILLTAACVACALSGAGRRVGFDTLLDEQLPSWLTLAKRERSGFLT